MNGCTKIESAAAASAIDKVSLAPELPAGGDASERASSANPAIAFRPEPCFRLREGYT